MEEKHAKKRMAEIEGGESLSKKLKTDAMGMPSLQAFDSILAAGIVREKKCSMVLSLSCGSALYIIMITYTHTYICINALFTFLSCCPPRPGT